MICFLHRFNKFVWKGSIFCFSGEGACLTSHIRMEIKLLQKQQSFKSWTLDHFGLDGGILKPPLVEVGNKNVAQVSLTKKSTHNKLTFPG